jgi:hypothetical protein
VTAMPVKRKRQTVTHQSVLYQMMY